MREEKEMSKEAFIRRLRELLAGLPQSEASEAIQYYEDYFADAGVENEEKVIEELGSPEKVAANIRADLGMPQTGDPDGGYGRDEAGSAGGGNDRTSRSQSSGDEYSDRTYDGISGAGENRHDGGWYGGDGYHNRRYEEPPKQRNTALWIVLAICTCYLWIPLLLVAVILVFVAIIMVCALSFAFAVTALALGVTGIALVGVAVVKMFVSPAAGLIILGAGLIMAGLTIFAVFLVGLLFGKVMPSFFRWIGSLGRKAHRRRGGM